MPETFHPESNNRTPSLPRGELSPDLLGVEVEDFAHQTVLDVQHDSRAEYTPDEVSKIIYESFRHSQGGMGLQEQILTFVGERHADRLSRLESSAEAVYDQLVSQTTRYVSRGAAHRRVDQSYIDERKRKGQKLDGNTPEEFITNQISSAIFNLIDGVNHEPANPFNPDKALDNIIEKDFSYLDPTQEGGRPRHGAGRDPHKQHKAVEGSHYASQLVLYGLIGEPTRMPEMNDFYQVVSADLPNYLDSTHPEHEQREQRLGTIIQAHLQHYPADAKRIQHQYNEFLVRHLGEAKAREIGLIF